MKHEKELFYLNKKIFPIVVQPEINGLLVFTWVLKHIPTEISTFTTHFPW